MEIASSIFLEVKTGLLIGRTHTRSDLKINFSYQSGGKLPHRYYRPRCATHKAMHGRKTYTAPSASNTVLTVQGAERRETVRSISGVGVRALRGPFPSTRGLGRTHFWCIRTPPCHDGPAHIPFFLY